MENKNQTKFNMAMIFYISLNKLIEKKDECYINDDLAGWYKTLKAIYRKIIFKIDKKENLIKDFDNAYNNLCLSMPRNVANGRATVFNSVSKILDKIDMELTMVMDKNHMIFPNIELKDGMQEFVKRYGFGGKD